MSIQEIQQNHNLQTYGRPENGRAQHPVPMMDGTTAHPNNGLAQARHQILCKVYILVSIYPP